MEIQFDGVIWKEENVYVSYCPELDVSSCGDTVEEARRMLKEAVALFLDAAEKMGTLNQILEEAGYRPRPDEGVKGWDSPSIVATERMEVQIG